MIGSIPSYTDPSLHTVDHPGYSQQPSYPGEFHDPGLDFQNGLNGGHDLSYASSQAGGAGQQQQYNGYSPSPSPGDLGSGMYSQGLQESADFQDGSFASIGAAFGFNPDTPIQISSHHLPQSPQPLLDAYMNDSFQFQFQPQQQPQQLQQQRFAPSSSLKQQQLPDNFQAPWNAHIPNSDFRQGKRARRSQTGEESDEEHEGFEMMEGAEGARRPTRLPGACVHCKSLKVKCEFGSGDSCKRCISSKKECIVMGRKPRRPPPKREELLNKIREQEAIIKAQEADIKRWRGKVEGVVHGTPQHTEPETALSPSSAHSQPRSPRVQDKDIQDWIDRARESANVSGDLEPSAVSSVDEHERLSAQDESEDESEGEPDSSPEPYLRPPGGKGTRRSPAVGTALSPIGLLASTALRRKPRRGSSSSAGGDKNSDVGPANESYFLPGMSTNPELRWSVRESQPPPRILASSLISPREVDKLFEIFFERMNLSVSLLDPQIYSAQTTYWRSPFLFTVICAIASRYLTERPELYSVLMSFAKMEAGQALVAGLKSPELVAGYILLSLYPVPSARWEEDRGWLMLGVAIRMATDLNLHHSSTAKITNEQQAREVANRTRIWINCYNLDRSTSTQFGKPSTIKEDYIARHSKFWYKTSGFNYDIHLNGYTQLLRVMAHFHDAIYSNPDTPTGLNKSIDFEAVTQKYEQELLDHWAEWEPRFQTESDPTSLHCLYRIELLRLANAYSRLVILSFRFQNALQKGLNRGDHFLQRCLDTASSVVKIVVENMAPHPFLRTAPDAQFVFASFGSVFLLKLLRPRFAMVLDDEQKENIITLVGRLIDVLQSEDVAIDERHTPKLYARFLAGLLDRHLSSRKSSSRRSSEQPSEMSEPSPFVTVEPPHVDPLPPHPVYHPPIVTPPSPRSGLVASFPDGASTVSSTIPARSYASSGRESLGVGEAGGMMMMNRGGTTDDGLLATMRAISNPLFWDDMMMPGFSWTPPGESQNGGFQQQQVPDAR